MSNPLDDPNGFVPAGLMNVSQIGPDKKVPARLTKKFEPKTWKPIYDQFVFHHCCGKSNIWIANEYDYTPQQVSNILNSTQGKVLKKIIAFNLQQQREQSIGERMGNVADKFMKRIEEVAEDDELFEKAPFAVIDRGLTILKSLSHLKGGSESPNGGSPTVNNVQINNNQRVTVIGEKAAQELRDAIRFSDEVNALHTLESEEQKNVVNTLEVKDRKDMKVLPLPIQKVG